MTTYAKGLLDQFHHSGQMPDTDTLTQPALFELYEGTWSSFVHEEEDIYTLLDIYKTERDIYPTTPNAVIVATTGWAAPLGANGEVEGRPSQHPQRFRVFMSTLVEEKGGLITRLVMHKPEGLEVVDDYGTATGSLSEALNLLGMVVWGRSWSMQMLTDCLEARLDGHPYPEEVEQGIRVRLGQLTKALATLGESDTEGEW